MTAWSDGVAKACATAERIVAMVGSLPRVPSIVQGGDMREIILVPVSVDDARAVNAASARLREAMDAVRRAREALESVQADTLRRLDAWEAFDATMREFERALDTLIMLLNLTTAHVESLGQDFARNAADLRQQSAAMASLGERMRREYADASVAFGTFSGPKGAA
jgi:uncharacterized protein YhaN